MNIPKIHPLGVNIIIGTLFARLATTMSMPFLAILLTTQKGISPSVTGLIIGISALVSIFTGIIGGNLSDKYGRKSVMMGSICLWILVFIGFSIADSSISFFILSALNGACGSFFEPSSRALLSETTDSKDKLLVFNLRYTAINIGVVLGPLFGLLLGSSQSTFPFIFTALIYTGYMLSLVITFKKYPLSTVKDISKNNITMRNSILILKNDSIFLIALIGFIFGLMGYSQFTSTFPQYFSHSTLFDNGVKLYTYIIVLNALTVLSLQYTIIKIGKKYSPLISILFGVILIGVSLIGIGFSKSIFLVFTCIFIFTIGEVLIFSMIDIFIDFIAPDQLKGTYFGAISFMNLGQVLGPWLGGILLGYFGYVKGNMVFGILGLICILGFPFLLVAKKKLDSKENIKYLNNRKRTSS